MISRYLLRNRCFPRRHVIVPTAVSAERRSRICSNVLAVTRLSLGSLHCLSGDLKARKTDVIKPQMNSLIVLVKNFVDDSTVRRRVDVVSEKFAEARELLDDARESVGTVYFKDDMKDAQDAIEEVLKDYENLLDTISENQRNDVVRSIGLKMQELKAQLNLLLEQILH